MMVPEHVTNHLAELGFSDLGTLYYALPPARLYEEAIGRGEGILAAGGPIVVRTDPNTGRSPKDRFIVQNESNKESIAWGDQNIPTDAETFDNLFNKMRDYAKGRDLFIKDLFAGADKNYTMPVRIITEKAWHNIFAHNMFVRRPAETDDFEPEFTVIDLCTMKADPEEDNTRSEVFVLVNFDEKLVLIGGTHYGGEMKKSIFSVLNYMLPEKGLLPMHCSANEGPDGDTAVFFGLSGTGKTTLSADASRTLIGDDEHAWSDDGIFNFEGGCYAKMIRISPEDEPEIYATTDKFGTVLENVVVDEETRKPDFDDDSITENTRGSYPLHYIPNASESGKSGHPENVVFLTYDAFGVLPPVSKLTPAQAMYHFLSGYTAKVAGTERGIDEPKATFSACFGAPFMVRHPAEYAELLGDKIRDHNASCWLVNTGITGGPHGEGKRVPLKHTRAMVSAVLSGDLEDVETEKDGVFGLHIPKHVPNVPDEVLIPRNTWDDPADYDKQAKKLADMFAENFKKFQDEAADEILEAGPVLQTAK